jgi:hypothetical protein
MLPPESSNYLSLFFSFLALIEGGVMTLQIVWDSPSNQHRVIFIGLVLAGILANRTFLRQRANAGCGPLAQQDGY